MIERAKCWEIVNNYPRTIEPCIPPSEETLEDWIEVNPNLLEYDVAVIGRQVSTRYGDAVDLLAIDANGDIIIIENKKEIAYREAIAQALDYASWVSELSKKEIMQISEDYFHKKKAILKLQWSNLEEVFNQKFQCRLDEININQTQKILIVAPRPDADAERIVRYLSVENDIDINFVTFLYFKSGEKAFIVKNVTVTPEERQLGEEKREVERMDPLKVAREGDWEDIAIALKNILISIKPTIKMNTQKSVYTFWDPLCEKGRALVTIECQNHGISIYIPRLAKYLGTSDDDLRNELKSYDGVVEKKYNMTEEEGTIQVWFIPVRTQETADKFGSFLKSNSG